MKLHKVNALWIHGVEWDMRKRKECGWNSRETFIFTSLLGSFFTKKPVFKEYN